MPYTPGTGLLPDPIILEISRLRAIGRYSDAEILADSLRGTYVSPSKSKAPSAATTEPKSSGAASERANSADPEKLEEEREEETATFVPAPSRQERIIALQDQITKVQFDAAQPSVSWTEPPPSSSGPDADYLHGSSSVEENARRVYEMAMAAVEQEEVTGSPKAKELRQNSSYSAYRDHEEYAPSRSVGKVDGPSARGVVLAKQFVEDIQETMVPLKPEEQRRKDHDNRIQQLRSELASLNAKTDPDNQLNPATESEIATRHRLRAIADVHGLQSSAAYLDATEPVLSSSDIDPTAPVVPTSRICPALYGQTASERILELKRASHDLDLDPRRSMNWSDLDRGQN